jgi:hypothetical protein
MDVSYLDDKVVKHFYLYSVKIALLSFSLNLTCDVLYHLMKLVLKNDRVENVIIVPLRAVLRGHKQVETLQCDLYRRRRDVRPGHHYL